MRQRGPESMEALVRVELELENAFAAQDWAQAAGEAALCADVLLPCSQVLRIRGKFALARERLERLKLALPADVSLQGRIFAICSRAAQDAGDWDRAREYIDHAWALLKDTPPSMAKAMAARQLGEVTRVRGNLEGAIPEFERALEEFRLAQDDHGAMSVYADLGVSQRMLLRLDESDALFEQAERMARALGDERALAAVLSNRGNVALQRGQLELAERLFIEAEGIARRYNDLMHLTACVGNRGNVYAVQGNWRKAAECQTESLEIDHEIGNKLGIAIQSSNMAQVSASMGEFEKGLAYIDNAIAAYRELGDFVSASHALGTRGFILMELQRWGEAGKDLHEVVNTQHRTSYVGSRQELRDMANLVYCEHKCGDAGARGRAAALLPLLENPPPKRDFTDEDMDRQVAQLKEVLA